ncbi:MAG: type II secretion system F family protein [Deltaproteobacteria bacterium]|nr:type II secretion system F family protein [Deltaproteobacteria bacterium]
MPKFQYHGRDRHGRLIKGVITAESKSAAVALLKQQAIQVMPEALKQVTEVNFNLFGGRVKLKDLVIFTRQFAVLVQAGLPITQALDLLSKQTESKTLARVLSDVKTKIETGETLSSTFSQHPNVFDSLYCNLIQAGEQGGFLEQVLARLSQYLEKLNKLKRELTVALIYPAILVLTAIIVVSVILIFVIPTFKEIFSEFGASLPLPTRVVIEISNFTVSYWYLIFGVMFALGFSAFRFYKSEKGKEFFEPHLIKVPVIGQIILKAAIARFSRTLGTMLGSGVPIIQALETCSRVAGSVLVEKAIKQTIKSVTEGRSINETLKEFKIFPPMVYGMIAVGEQTGSLETMLEKLAAFYEEEVETAVQSLKQLLEPVLIVVIGVIIGGLVVSMYLPIFKLGSVIG